MLIIKNLQCEYDGKSLFQPINLHLGKGACLQLLGDNGVGKTTTLKILAGLKKKRRGHIRWNDQTEDSLKPYCTYLGYELALKSTLTVHENLHYYAALWGAHPDVLKKAYAYFELEPYLERPIETLSSGLKRRCQLAKLLIKPAQIWLLDEPFTFLDHLHVSQLRLLFHTFCQQAGIILFTSHHPVPSDTLSIIAYPLLTASS